jgi:hypothetical protein
MLGSDAHQEPVAHGTVLITAAHDQMKIPLFIPWCSTVVSHCGCPHNHGPGGLARVLQQLQLPGDSSAALLVVLS